MIRKELSLCHFILESPLLKANFLEDIFLLVRMGCIKSTMILACS